MDGLKPYPAMKASSVAWLGAVPEHWQVLPNRALFLEIKDNGFPHEEMLSVTINQGVIRQSALLSESSKKDSSNEDKSKYKLVSPGDIAYNKMRAWQGAIGVSRVRGIVSPAYIVVRPRDQLYARYFHYLFRTPVFAKEAERWSYGISSDQWSLRPEHFKQVYCLVPPRDELALIIRFLDHSDRLIRRYVGAKRKLIKLLEEQKQEIIYRAVTRGLDPNVPLKPSRVEWLGAVPEHWDVSALRHHYKQCLGKMLDTKRITGAHLVPYLRNTDVQWERINTEQLPQMDIPESEYERYTLRRGDLLVCEGGEIGRAAIWDSQRELCGFQKALHRLRPQSCDRDDPRFLLLQLRIATATGAFDDGHQSTISHLTGEKLRRHRFVFPPLEEQQAIIDQVGALTAAINKALTCAELEIGNLCEYRTRLIADVVTGKLDVRGAAAALPETSQELEEVNVVLEPDEEDELEDAGEAEVEEAAA
jgi:type I restriction enzyme S subunit